MRKFEQDIQYWANMLNEAFEPRVDERMIGPVGAAKHGVVDQIADMRAKLNSGVVEFEFVKVDGSIRHAIGTTSELVISVAKRKQIDPNYDINLESYKKREAYIIWFWDLEKNAARCFNTNRFKQIIKFEPVTSQLKGTINKVGNIFFHNDIDTGFETSVPSANPVQIAADVKSNFAAKSETMSEWTSAVPGANIIGKFSDVEYSKNEDGEPMLVIKFAKNITPDDPPYQICVNDMRKYILDKYGVEIKDVRVYGRFQY